MKEIDIWWEGPFDQDEIIDNDIDKNFYDNTADKIGLYQIYGTHPLYGNDVLLYIGRTKGKKGFLDRLKNRWVIENGNDAENVTIYLGTIYSANITISPEEENRQIDLAEVLLIFALKPAYNSSNIQSIGRQYLEKKYLIKNMNNYRNLYPVLSSEYFLQDSILNIELTDKLAKVFKGKKQEDDNYYGFLISNKNIFIGVDYECWNETKVPLHIGISINIEKNILNKIIKEDKKLKYKDEEFYYISAAKFLNDKTLDEKVDEIKERVERIKKLINGV